MVSVVIPCYNVENFIEECINSVYKQSYSDIEVICVDNNSKDKTMEILLKLKRERYPNLIIDSEKKKGASSARNKGLAIAKGDWIQFLDADDLLLCSKIERQIALLSESTEKDIAFVVGDFYRRNVKGVDKEVRCKNKDAFKSLFVSNLGITSANLFNRKKISETGGWNEQLYSSQEAELMFRMLKNGWQYLFDDNLNTIIREREFGQISSQNFSENWHQHIKLRLDVLEYLKKEKEKYFIENQEYYLQNLFILVRILFKHNRQAALQIYNDNFEPDFIPKINSKKNIYSWVFALLGFYKTEVVYTLFNPKN